MIRIFLIRHGATAGNLERRYIGRTDEGLCPLGEEQVRRLKPPQADRLFVSPMRRTRQTAAILYPGRPFTAVEDLRETDFGRFEGKTADQLSSDPAYQAWVDSGCTEPIPEGEAVDAFKKRCCRAFWEAASALEDGTSAAFVIHGGGIMAILEAFARPKRNFYDYHIGNGELVEYRLEQGVLRLAERAGTEEK